MRICLFVAFCLGSLSAQSFSFKNVLRDFPAGIGGLGPNTVALGDLNGDGKADAVLGDFALYPGGVTVMLGKGDGTFQPPANITVGDYIVGVALADFNGDGKLDLVAADYATTPGVVWVLLGNGDGTFQAPVSYPAGASPHGVAVADFNGDGKPDIAVANQTGGVSVLLGNGDGTFQPPEQHAAGGTGCVLVLAADLNGDGIPDLVTGNYGNSISVLLGASTGGFGEAITTSTGAADESGVSALAIADFNGDRKPDVAVVGASGSAYQALYLAGNGDGTFQSPQVISDAVGYGSLLAADLNRDGHIDLVSCSGAGSSLSVFLGNGDGTFLSLSQVAVGFADQGIGAADLNGDGILDLVTANADDATVSVLIGTGSGAFHSAPAYKTGASPVWVAIADLNNDGKNDLAVADADAGAISVLLGKGNGTFKPPVNLRAGKQPAAVIAVDLNGDGIPDLVSANEGGDTVSVLLGLGNGSFKPAVNYAVGTRPIRLVAGDFNGDGKPDLAVLNVATRSVPGTVSILLGNGDGTFQSQTSIPAGLNPTGLAMADFNRDGKLDLAVAIFGGKPLGGGTLVPAKVLILLGNGSGGFEAQANSPALAGNSVAAGDLNGDGIPDLAVVGGTSVSVLIGNGNGTFQPPVAYFTNGTSYDGVEGNGLVGIAIGDLNGDRKADVAVTNNDSNSVSVFLGNGDGTLQPVLLFGTDFDPVSVAIDAKGNMVTANSGANDVSIFLKQP